MGEKFLFQRMETRPDIPETGRFLLPVCVDKDELLLLLRNVERYSRETGDFDYTALLSILQAVEYIGRPEEALCYEGGYNGMSCLTYPPFSSFVQYFPDDPYIAGEEIPENYVLPAWWKWGELETILPDYIDDIFNELLEDFTGYKPNDALTWLGSFPIGTGWDDFLDLGGVFPRIEIKVTGKGQANITFLSFPAGGRVLVELDEMPNIADIVFGGILDPNSQVIDVDRDLASFPPEESPINVYPVEIEEEGDHIIYCVFLPLVNDSVIPIGFGGGIREVELCGGLRPTGTPPPPPPPDLEGVTELRPDFQFTVECGLEYRLLNQDSEVVQDWTPVSGWDENAHLCFGGGEVATKEDLREALKEWTQWGAGKILNVTFDDEGNPVYPDEGGEGGEGIPDDDPATPAINENFAARAGGVNGVTRGYNLIWTDMSAWKTAAVPTADMIVRLKSKYIMNDDPLTEQFVIAYETAWPSKVNNFVSTTLDPMLFCGGSNFKNTVANYIIGSISSPLQPEAFALNDAISDEQITLWYTKGAGVPSTAYEAFSCIKIQDELLNFNMATVNNPQITTAETWKINHRMLIDVTGSFVDTDVPNVVYDGMWEINTVTGVKTFKPINFNFSGGVTGVTSTLVPYRADHHYTFTIDKTNASAAGIITVDNGSAAVPNITGTITVLIKDLGEVIA